MVFKGLVGVADKPNLNRRLYPKETLENVRKQLNDGANVYPNKMLKINSYAFYNDPIGKVVKSFWDGDKLVAVYDVNKIPAGTRSCCLSLMGRAYLKNGVSIIESDVKVIGMYLDTECSAFGDGGIEPIGYSVE